MEKEISPAMERMDSEYVDALNGVEPEPPQRLTIPMKFNMDVNLGINLSIALILLIFSGLLFLPSKMLLDTSYEVQNESDANRSSLYTLNFLNSMEFRKRRLCPGLDYKYWMVSTFYSNYDRNCTYTGTRAKKIDKKVAADSFTKNALCSSDKKETIITYNYNGTIDEIRATRPKSIPVTGHILAMMLIVSAVAAFVEVLRIRFINPKDTPPAVETTGSRKGSTVELMIHGRFVPRAPMRNQRSFELQGMHRSALRLLGTAAPSAGSYISSDNSDNSNNTNTHTLLEIYKTLTTPNENISGANLFVSRNRGTCNICYRCTSPTTDTTFLFSDLSRRDNGCYDNG